jgi:hypothetical protein
MGLCGIFDDSKPILVGQCQNAAHGRWFAKEMNWHKRARPWRDGGFELYVIHENPCSRDK